MPRFKKATKTIKRIQKTPKVQAENSARIDGASPVENHKQDVNYSFNDFIAQAIEAYYEENPSARDNEKASRYEIIKKIQSILEQKASNGEPIKDDVKITEIQALIWGTESSEPSYYRGFLGRSYLADCIQAALSLYASAQLDQTQKNNIVEIQSQGFYAPAQAVINAYLALQSRMGEKKLAQDITLTTIYETALREAKNPNPAKVRIQLETHTKLSKKDKNYKAKKAARELYIKFEQNIKKEAAILRAGVDVKSITETREYTLAHYFLFAIQEFQDYKLSKGIKVKELDDLKKLIEDNKNLSDRDFNRIVMDFLGSDNSRYELKQFLLNARSQYVKMLSCSKSKRNPNGQRDFERTRVMKHWSKNPEQQKDRKVILAIHGLGDSLTTWEGQVQQWIDAGYEVISYDHAGHGFDSLRSDKSTLDIRQMRYDFYDQLTRLQNDGSIDEIHLVGHSLGGALLLNCYATIQENLQPLPQDKNKVVSMTCIDPSIMQNAWIDSIRALPTQIFNTGDMDPSAKILRPKLGASRIGGASPFSSLRDFIRTLARGFKNLRHISEGKYKTDNLVPCLILSADKDNLVPVSNFRRLQGFFKDPKNKFNYLKQFFTFKFLKNVGHHPHAAGSQTSHIVSSESIKHMSDASKKKALQQEKPSEVVDKKESGLSKK